MDLERRRRITPQDTLGSVIAAVSSSELFLSYTLNGSKRVLNSACYFESERDIAVRADDVQLRCVSCHMLFTSLLLL
jgi:hypothetical protein